MKLKFFSDLVFVISLLTAIAAASTEVPLWISALTLALLAWKYAHEKWQVRKISVPMSALVAAFVILIVFIQKRTLIGPEESTTVLLGLVAVTILNYDTLRDRYFLIMLGFLLVTLKALFTLDFIWILPAFIAFFGFWYSLILSSKINKFKFLLKITLQALPLFAVLFFLFPRIVVFQSERIQNRYNTSGFSENLNPGRVAEIALQNRQVFRVEFKDQTTRTQEMYWRGSVLSRADGLIWKKEPPGRPLVISKSASADLVTYKVILDTMGVRNIFVLETPVQLLSSSLPVEHFDNQLYSLASITNQQIQFEAQSSKQLLAAAPNDTESNLEIPELPPLSKALVAEIRNSQTTLEARADALEKFFTDSAFVYTLRPGTYSNNLDEFLFERKRGFCEHFAASYASLARALGIPARVVLGYQGGLFNRLGNFWTISQRDSHAWVEILIHNEWRRIDPTSWVSPLRIELGGEAFFSLSEDEQIANARNLGFTKDDFYEKYAGEFKALFENFNYQWTLFLLNYDLQTQLDFLSGFQGNWMVGVGFIAFIFLFVIYSRRKPESSEFRTHPISQLVQEIELWAQNRGVKITLNQTPLQALNTIAIQFPSLSGYLNEVSAHYERSLYKSDSAVVSIKVYEKRWKSLSNSIPK